MAPTLSSQPMKGVATLAVVLAAPPYFAMLSLLYAAKYRRPVPTWTLKTAIGVAWLRLFYRYATAVRLGQFHANPSKLKERYVLVQPGPTKLYTGILTHETIKPVAAPAIWFPKPLSDVKGHRSENCPVVIHFPGGAFVTATDPVETGTVPSQIFEETLGAVTFYAQYRLSVDNGTRFPAALQDAVTFYQYILDQGVDPSNIIISGDSAGGSLVIALLRYIEEHGTLPSPRGAMVWSPWVDISAQTPNQHKGSPRLQTDFVTLGLAQWGREAYEPVRRTEQTERYLVPVEHPFTTRTPLFINSGSVELSCEEVKLFAKKMGDVEGSKIMYLETKDAPHDILLAGGFTGFVKEAGDAVEQAAKFFDLSK